MTKAIKVSPLFSREDWLNERRNGIGGSDVAAVLGLNPYRTPLDVYMEKTGETKPAEPGQAAYFGTILEDIVAHEFQKRTGMKVQRVNYTLADGEGGWMRGNIDRAVINPQIAKRVVVNTDKRAKETGRILSTNIGLECKTANTFMADLWGPSQEEEIVAGKVVTDHKIPLYYETQIQWYMAVANLDLFYVAVLLGGSDFRIYEVKRDKDVIDALKAACRDFWFGRVKAGIKPDPVNASDVRKLYEREDGTMEEADNDVAADIGELRTIKERMKILKEEEKAVSSRLILAIAEKTGYTIDGAKAVTYKAVTTNRIDAARLKKEHPDIYEEFSKQTTTRTLKLF